MRPRHRRSSTLTNSKKSMIHSLRIRLHPRRFVHVYSMKILRKYARSAKSLILWRTRQDSNLWPLPSEDNLRRLRVPWRRFLREELTCHSGPIEASEDQQANPAHAVADCSTPLKRLKLRADFRGHVSP
jgi:hypothetical protein